MTFLLAGVHPRTVIGNALSFVAGGFRWDLDWPLALRRRMIGAMRITLESTGGFTGPAGTDRWSADLAKLPEQQRKRLTAAVMTAQLADQPSEQRKTAPEPWDFLQTLSVEDDAGKVHTVKFHLDAATPLLRGLLDTIQSIRSGDPAPQ